MSNPPFETPPDPSTPEHSGPGITAKCWVTRTTSLVCVAIFLGLNSLQDGQAWSTFVRFCAPSASDIWDGSWWALVTTAFVHLEIWHVFFNVYWLWILGHLLERAIGSWRMLAFIVVSAWVSSGCQLAVGGQTGIGFSGVAYAMFGFMWLSRHRYTEFNSVLDSRTIFAFVLWLVVCIIVSKIGVWSIGNTAHASGLAFGAGVAALLVLRWQRPAVLPALAALLLFSSISLFWMPWSVSWLAHQAKKYHEAEKWDVALDYYTRVIERDPTSAWAHINRSQVYTALGQFDKALADFQKARELRSPDELSE